MHKDLSNDSPISGYLDISYFCDPISSENSLVIWTYEHFAYAFCGYVSPSLE
jgi:hypothetical protein